MTDCKFLTGYVWCYEKFFSVKKHDFKLKKSVIFLELSVPIWERLKIIKPSGKWNLDKNILKG